MKRKLKHHFPMVRNENEIVDPHPQRAAVMVILYPKHNKTHVLMIKRSLDLKIHPGEIAFPGGIFEPEDEHLLGTALRETEEEVELELPVERVIARFPIVYTQTGFEVTPFVAVLDKTPVVTNESDEVEEILEIPFVKLLSTQQRDVGYKLSEEMVAYWHDTHRVWGASAKILCEFDKLVHQ